MDKFNKKAQETFNRIVKSGQICDLFAIVKRTGYTSYQGVAAPVIIYSSMVINNSIQLISNIVSSYTVNLRKLGQLKKNDVIHMKAKIGHRVTNYVNYHYYQHFPGHKELQFTEPRINYPSHVELIKPIHHRQPVPTQRTILTGCVMLQNKDVYKNDPVYKKGKYFRDLYRAWQHSDNKKHFNIKEWSFKYNHPEEYRRHQKFMQLSVSERKLKMFRGKLYGLFKGMDRIPIQLRISKVSYSHFYHNFRLVIHYDEIMVNNQIILHGPVVSNYSLQFIKLNQLHKGDIIAMTAYLKQVYYLGDDVTFKCDDGRTIDCRPLKIVIPSKVRRVRPKDPNREQLPYDQELLVGRYFSNNPSKMSVDEYDDSKFYRGLYRAWLHSHDKKHFSVRDWSNKYKKKQKDQDSDLSSGIMEYIKSHQRKARHD